MFPCCSGRDGKKHDDALLESVPLSRDNSSEAGSGGVDGPNGSPRSPSKLSAGAWRWLPGQVAHTLTALSSGWEGAERAMRNEHDKSERPIDQDITHVFALRNLHNTPAYLHNPHILSGYRVHFSRDLALRSLFRLHNETLNIWTHLLPALWFTWRFAWAMLVELPAMQLEGQTNSDAPAQSCTRADYWSFAFFYASVCACFYLSALYHLMSCCSYDMHSCLYRCDVSGILSLICGSYLPALHYAFRCRPQLQWGYSGVVGALVAALFVMFNVPACNSRKLHSVRVGALVLSVAFAVMPSLHFFLGVLAHDYPSVPAPTLLLPLVAMLACYLAGFLLYSRHVPEKWAPGRFDLALQSHNFWHLLVVAAAAVWETELWTMLRIKHMAAC